MAELNKIESGVSDNLLPDNIQTETITRQRVTSTEVCANNEHERQRIYALFKKYDRDDDDLLDVKELKNLISSQMCQDMSQGLIKHILKMNDPNGDKQLNFEEFYKLSQHNKWILQMDNFVDNYCNKILPTPCRHVTNKIAKEHIPIKLCPPPLTMLIFSIIEIVFFLIDVIYFHDDPNNKKKLGENLKGPAATIFIYNPYRRYEVWRFISYMFVHIGIMHLVMNLLIQILLGIALEYRHHWWRVSVVYLAGVLAGSLGTSLTSSTSFLAGASGGVYALIGAHISTIIMNWNETQFGIVQFIGFTVYCLLDLGTSIYRHLNDEIQSSVGYNAHLCGFIAGLLVGIAVLRNLKKHKWERILWWIAVLIYIVIISCCIFTHIFYYDYFPIQEKI